MDRSAIRNQMPALVAGHGVFAHILHSEDDLELSATETQLFLQVVQPPGNSG